MSVGIDDSRQMSPLFQASMADTKEQTTSIFFIKYFWHNSSNKPVGFSPVSVIINQSRNKDEIDQNLQMTLQCTHTHTHKQTRARAHTHYLSKSAASSNGKF